MRPDSALRAGAPGRPGTTPSPPPPPDRLGARRSGRGAPASGRRPPVSGAGPARAGRGGDRTGTGTPPAPPPRPPPPAARAPARPGLGRRPRPRDRRAGRTLRRLGSRRPADGAGPRAGKSRPRVRWAAGRGAEAGLLSPAPPHPRPRPRPWGRRGRHSDPARDMGPRQPGARRPPTDAAPGGSRRRPLPARP